MQKCSIIGILVCKMCHNEIECANTGKQNEYEHECTNAGMHSKIGINVNVPNWLNVPYLVYINVPSRTATGAEVQIMPSKGRGKNE